MALLTPSYLLFLSRGLANRQHDSTAPQCVQLRTELSSASLVDFRGTSDMQNNAGKTDFKKLRVKRLPRAAVRETAEHRYWGHLKVSVYV